MIAGTVLLLPGNREKPIMPLEEKVEITKVRLHYNPERCISFERMSENPSPQPYSEPERNPNEYDPILDAKAILEPEDKLYDTKKAVS